MAQKVMRNDPDGIWAARAYDLAQAGVDMSRVQSDTVEKIEPTSKTQDHPEYDSRLEDVLKALTDARPGISYVRPIVRRVSTVPQHKRDERQKTSEIYANLSLVDDVVTIGRTYAACRRLIHENVPGIKTFGVFWARTVWV